jgi:hypothetical protein
MPTASRSISKTSYRIRARGRCSKEVLMQRKRLETGVVYLALAHFMIAVRRELRRRLLLIGTVNLTLYYYYKSTILMNRRWQWRPKPSFQALDEYWCWRILRFRKKHLWRISEALLLPRELHLDNNMETNNEKMLIVTLLRFSK